MILYKISLFSDILQRIQLGFSEYHQTKVRPIYLDEALQKFQLPHFFRRQEQVLSRSLYDNPVICDLCSVIVNFVIEERRMGMSDINIKGELQSICSLLNIETPRVCAGTIDSNAVSNTRLLRLMTCLIL